MRRWQVAAWLTLLVTVTVVYGGLSLRNHYRREQALAQQPTAEDLAGFKVGQFQLQERSGQPFDSASLNGHVWVASFFFSNCPGACLQLNGSISRLHKEMADVPVTFVSISVDPETDTPERLREYAASFNADEKRWLFLTGELAVIKRVAMDDFRVPFEKTFHSERLILVDQHGVVQGYYSGTDPGQLISLKRRIRLLTESKA